jgi:glycosyltransferase involved in cell wall biosynthesis
MSASARADPKVSVLVKAFNHAKYVRQTIDSVLAQSFQDFEIVVTDDGSTDGTLEVLRGFADPRIRLEAFEHNQGISAAMNATIARARGRYLAILNSDDWALPGRLQRQVSFLDAHPDISLLFGLPMAVDEVGEPTTPFNDFEVPLSFPDFSRRSWLRYFFFHDNCLCAPTAMIRREAYDAVGAYDRRLTNMQDYDMWIRMLIAGRAIHVLAEPLTAFRIRDNNANMSAPRQDTNLRVAFEKTRILNHFAELDADVFDEVFGADAAEPAGASVGLRLAELALRVPGPEYQTFGLGLFYENARETADFHRLRELTGSIDAYGLVDVRRTGHLSADESKGVVKLQLKRLKRYLAARKHATMRRLAASGLAMADRLPRPLRWAARRTIKVISRL